MKKRIGLLLLLLTLILSGCVIRSPEELYVLPRRTEELTDLQIAIDGVMGEGVQYSSPLNGTNRQPVQLADLDGDGEDEAVVFLKTEGDLPLKACVFDRVDGDYRNVFVIEGDGSAFAQVEYAQLDGAGGQEIIIGRQLGGQVLQSIGAYGVVDGQLVELLSSSYSEFAIADVDGNGNRDLFLMRVVSEGRAGIAELYRFVDGEMARDPELSLSVGVGSVRNIQVGSLSPDVPAIFVGGVLPDSDVNTDVFSVRDGTFFALSSVNDLHLHSGAVRGYNVFAADIDGDGVTELPDVRRLPTASAEEEPYDLIRWLACDPESGELTLKMTTYHHYSGGWFVRLPERFGNRMSICRGNSAGGVQGLVFSLTREDGQTAEELFTIYAFSGSDRNSLASAENRFPVGSKGDVTYAAQLGRDAQTHGLSQAELTSMFSFIRVDWNSGET